MASIEKRGNNTWRLTVEIGSGPKNERRRERKTIKIETEIILKSPKKMKEYLNEELIKFKIEVEAGEYISADKMKLSDFVGEWETKYAAKELSPLTLKTYKHHITNHIIPAVGHRRLDEIKPMHLVTLLSDLKKPGARKDGRGEILSDRTVQYIYDVMRNIFTQAVGWRLIKESPLQGVKKPKVEKKKAEYYDVEETQKVINALNNEPLKWRMFCLAAILGGFRRGELIALEWMDVLFDENAIHIRKSISLVEKGHAHEKGTKNEEERTVEMPHWYMEELKKYNTQWNKNKRWRKTEWLGEETQYLFHNGSGKPFYHTTPSAWWKDFIKRHDLKYISLHKLRHTSASVLIEKGASLKAIQERLGHKQHQTTADIYAHVSKKVSRDLADKFDQFNPGIQQTNSN